MAMEPIIMLLVFSRGLLHRSGLAALYRAQDGASLIRQGEKRRGAEYGGSRKNERRS
jgi:hypothetical protein